MPNWCYTNIHFVNEDKKEIKKLYKLIGDWTSKDAMESGFGLTWLGNVVLNSGIGTINTNPDTDISCRGSISDYSITEEQLVVVTETAWSPMLEMWVKIVDKHSPETEIYYTAEELGCEILCTNDPDVDGKYYLDSWDEEYECYDCIDEESLIPILQSYLDTDESEINSLIDLLDDLDDSELSVHQWEYVNINEWD